ncbi:MAG: ATP citrate lyase citrate-binding domain-containing protein [Thermodesulfobacteriota bacterium]|nr:ATP citrate lyase citrate-binding domain-containing protein [Thermodesulfobacteriota bacterium]
MAQKPIREYDAKSMLAKYWQEYIGQDSQLGTKVAQVTPETDLDKLAKDNPWLTTEQLVVKPDMIMGKRGKHGLILLNADWNGVKKWLKENRGKEVTVGNVNGELTHFLIEPFVKADNEYYVAIKSERDGDTIYFSTKGGVDIEENWERVLQIMVPTLGNIDDIDMAGKLPKDLKEDRKRFAQMIKGLFKYYTELGYTFLEINPFAIKGDKLYPLDLKCRIDDTAEFECGKKWGDISFPAPFGRKLSKEEVYINELDSKSGASLKLTILNPKGRIWNLVAGGGASVIYTDTVADMGFAEELANYGEYSGDPSMDETYEYAKTVLDLMTREKPPKGKNKYLIIGGGIANFTDVAKTFAGIIKALREYKDKLNEANVKIYIRRGGPNYLEGLKKMKDLAKEGIPIIEVHGPEYPMTKVVASALENERK